MDGPVSKARPPPPLDGRLEVEASARALLDGAVFLTTWEQAEIFDAKLRAANFAQRIGRVTFAAKKPGATFEPEPIGISFVSKKPTITIE
jgi:hypothetical protein